MTTEQDTTSARTTAFDDAKFGMFVHWGAYSVGGVEASWPVMLGRSCNGVSSRHCTGWA